MPLLPVDRDPTAGRTAPGRRRLLAILGGGLLVAACQPAGPMTTAYAPSSYAPPPDRRVLLTVNFAFNSYRIPRDAQPLIDNLAAALLAPELAGAQFFTIDGHTDVVGRLGYNLGLSTLRAGAVLDALAARGVPVARLRAQGFGPLRLLDPTNPRSGVNRRVEVVATY
jgi:outer membrane protein OmpA-like peptidoglycan-associated protein